MSSEAAQRAAVVRLSKSLFDRGLTPGSSGNISVRLDDGWLFTPTNACLGFLDADRLSKLDAAGRHVSGDPPTKELPLHFGFYEARPQAGAVVHLHSTYATLLSCLADIDPTDAIPPITPYVVMRVGRVPVLPYTMPGSPDVKPLVMAAARSTRPFCSPTTVRSWRRRRWRRRSTRSRNSRRRRSSSSSRAGWTCAGSPRRRSARSRASSAFGERAPV